MEKSLDRLRKILTTLLIDYSEEEIQTELEKLPDHYKKVTREHFSNVTEQKIFIKVKGIEHEPAVPRSEQPRDKYGRPRTPGVYRW